MTQVPGAEWERVWLGPAPPVALPVAVAADRVRLQDSFPEASEPDQYPSPYTESAVEVVPVEGIFIWEEEEELSRSLSPTAVVFGFESSAEVEVDPDLSPLPSCPFLECKSLFAPDVGLGAMGWKPFGLWCRG